MHYTPFARSAPITYFSIIVHELYRAARKLLVNPVLCWFQSKHKRFTKTLGQGTKRLATVCNQAERGHRLDPS